MNKYTEKHADVISAHYDVILVFRHNCEQCADRYYNYMIDKMKYGQYTVCINTTDGGYGDTIAAQNKCTLLNSYCYMLESLYCTTTTEKLQ